MELPPDQVVGAVEGEGLHQDQEGVGEEGEELHQGQEEAAEHQYQHQHLLEL